MILPEMSPFGFFLETGAGMGQGDRNWFSSFYSKALTDSIQNSRGWTGRNPTGVDRKGVWVNENPAGSLVRSMGFSWSVQRGPLARPAWLTHALELHGQAAQLEGFSNQAHLRTVHMRATQVEVIQQALDAPGDAPAGNPVHAACGEERVCGEHMPPSSSSWEVGSHLSNCPRSSHSQHCCIGTRSFSAVGRPVHCRVLSRIPGLHPPGASSIAPPPRPHTSHGNQKHTRCQVSPGGQDYPWLRITRINNRQMDRQIDKIDK